MCPQGKGGERGPLLAGHCLSSLLFLWVCSSPYSSQPPGRRLLGGMRAILIPGSALAYPTPCKYLNSSQDLLSQHPSPVLG